jgi:dihydropteroate synthase
MHAIPETCLSWHAAPGKVIDLRTPRLLGIVNVTPDSFADGGTLHTASAAADRAAAMIAAGAIGVDIGGESTRPGASRVPAEEQIARILPALRAIRSAIGPSPLITIDTTLSTVARAALEAGADAVNDVSAATESPDMLALCAAQHRGIILMHRLRPPNIDQYSTHYPTPPHYGDIIHEVGHYLAQRALAALEAGVARDSIMLDPGLGFGKSIAHNLELIDRTPELAELGYPILSGLSRKSFVGAFMNLPTGHTPAQRLSGTIELSLRHAALGAQLLRVHDVPEHAAALSATTKY